ncbi:DUF2145 domain-containing protein [Glaciecola sp. 1036]|uniref:DUF2145 domain-containing protein n=1 Tax=Alteromonadaceae TaxID=72275 RepID=UPI003CFDD5C7
MKKYLFILISCGLILFSSTDVQAGSQANAEAKFAPEEIINFAKSVEQYAAQKGARAFLIARVGRPSEDLPKGIHFTHTAVAIYSQVTLDSGEQAFGYAIYNLYQKADDKKHSFLMTDYPVDFFWGAQELNAGIIIPNKDVQLGLIQLIASGNYKALHNENYSVIASPFNSTYQNCTEFTLDMVNSAIYSTTDIPRLKANARSYFDAQRVHTSRFKLMLGGIFMEDVSTRDHKDKVETATFTSIGRYLKKYDLVTDAVSLRQVGTDIQVTQTQL